MDDIARSGYWPASCRLLDNLQFKFGQALKVKNERKADDYIDEIKKFYLLNIKGFNVDKMCAVTMAFEGNKSDIQK